MSEWKKVKLGEVLQVKKGEYITKKEAKEGIYPVILGGKEPAYYIDRYNHTGKAIVISRSGASAGYVSFWNEPIFVTDGFLIEPKDDVNFEFLYYILKSKQRELHNTQKGAAIPHVTPTLIGSIDGLLPDIFTQQGIVSILSRYDSLIENYQKQIKLLEEAAQRLYKEWFVDLHFPGHENTKIVDGVPEGWEKKRITDLLDIKYGKDHKKLLDGIIPVYGTGGIMRYANSSLYTGESVLIPRKGSLNNIMLVDGTFWTIDTMFYSIPKIKNSAKIAYFYLCEHDMYSMNIGAAVPSMTINILNGMELLLPNDNLRKEFEKFVGDYYRQISSLQSQIRLLTEARDRLLPKLMSGEMELGGGRPERPLSYQPNGNALGINER